MSRRGRSFAGLVFGVCAGLWPGEGAVAGPEGRGLEDLMAGMSRTRGVVTRFHEVKELAILETPIESRGLLYFVPPDRMVRLTEEPLRTALVVDGRRIRFHEDGGAAPMDLSGEPTARQFVENFAVLFTGDLEELRKRYRVAFEADGDTWQLRLEPRSVLVRRLLDRVLLRGDGTSLRELEIVESDGDRTLTRIEPIDRDRAFSAAELRELLEHPLAAAPP